MTRIRVLTDGVINRIAAGEVVERPASVVKELVENSLDAGATRVEIRVAAGGRQAIEVADDGCGMSREDALLCLERHATSKLADSSDLEAIGTYGFRGEAISSVAAVSQFRVTTATEPGAATEIRVRGGRIESVEAVSGARGTTILAERLFFNVPARRKFLRAPATELAHVTRHVTRLALAHPEVAFVLRADERTHIETRAVAGRGERIAELYGAEALERLIPFREERPGLVVEGYAGLPAEARPRRDRQHLFVNGRAVQDRTLMHAVGASYRNRTIPGQHATLFLFVDVDPAEVDVNVHPQKTEVRFRASSRIHDAVREALDRAIGGARTLPTYGSLTSAPVPPAPAEPPRAAYRSAPRDLELFQPSGEARPGFFQAPAPRVEAAEPQPPAAEQPATLLALAQYKNCYIVARDGDGLVIVDQHAAHERVLFEQFLAAAERDEVELQPLLFPAQIELGPEESAIVEEEREEFARLGFRLEPFGGSTWRIEAVPAVTSGLEPERVVSELVGEAARARSARAEIEVLRRRLVTTAACKAAIKFNDPLNQGAMQALLDDLLRCESPTTCPHGRPVLFRLTDRELERTFGRH